MFFLTEDVQSFFVIFNNQYLCFPDAVDATRKVTLLVGVDTAIFVFR